MNKNVYSQVAFSSNLNTITENFPHPCWDVQIREKIQEMFWRERKP